MFLNRRISSTLILVLVALFFTGCKTKYEKFKEASDLIRAEGAFSVRNAQELSEKLTKLLQNEDARKDCGSMNKRYVYGQRGASEAVYHALIRELKSNIHPSEAR